MQFWVTLYGPFIAVWDRFTSTWAHLPPPVLEFGAGLHRLWPLKPL